MRQRFIAVRRVAALQALCPVSPSISACHLASCPLLAPCACLHQLARAAARCAPGSPAMPPHPPGAARSPALPIPGDSAPPPPTRYSRLLSSTSSIMGVKLAARRLVLRNPGPTSGGSLDRRRQRQGVGQQVGQVAGRRRPAVVRLCLHPDGLAAQQARQPLRHGYAPGARCAAAPSGQTSPHGRWPHRRSPARPSPCRPSGARPAGRNALANRRKPGRSPFWSIPGPIRWAYPAETRERRGSGHAAPGQFAQALPPARAAAWHQPALHQFDIGPYRGR